MMGPPGGGMPGAPQGGGMGGGGFMGDDDEFRGHPVTDVIRMGVQPVNWGINNENVPQSKQAITSASVKNTIGETLMG